MDAEFDALIACDGWELWLLPQGKQPIMYKWVYAYNTKPDGGMALNDLKLD